MRGGWQSWRNQEGQECQVSRVSRELSKACQLGFCPGAWSLEMRREEKVGKGQSDLLASTFFSDSFSFNIHQAQVLYFGVVYP